MASGVSLLFPHTTSWHTPVHRLNKQPFVWNKSVWLLLQHNLFFITSENVISSASNKKQFESTIFHCDFKLFYFHYKTKVLGWSFFSRKFYMKTLISEDVKTTILFFLTTHTQKCFLQKNNLGN